MYLVERALPPDVWRGAQALCSVEERGLAHAPGSCEAASGRWTVVEDSLVYRFLEERWTRTFCWPCSCRRSGKRRTRRCAGVCCYEGHGGMCSIRLSEPLLKLRPRKDLVETLLHEMIHALLFVTNNDKDRESHGPEFCKHMHRINRLTGANITIYHEFHDEVDFYRQHWWRCNGPCRNRKPYYGYVKRVMNRAPSANDYWWAEHQKSCGGTYTKVREPDNSSKKCKKKNDEQAKILDDSSRKARGSSIQSIIPFSGKGYILGGKRSESSLEGAVSPSIKSRQLIQSQYHSSADSSRSNPKNEIKFEQNVSCTTVSSLFSQNSPENSSASTITFPRFSVANRKVYTNVNGSPVKNISLGGKRSESNSTKTLRDILHKGTPENTISKSATLTPRSQSPSQRNSNTQTGGPAKRARMEDSVTFVNYFLKKGELKKETSSAVNSTAKPAISETSTSDQNRNVCCPVCQSEVLETKINEHLDLCLSKNF
ncbi:sprT-like domain-containing protein Spartan isoform X2 [Pseudonaja textilis]|uniref:sprT-like domain-containing protein Spartan isoform X2 n=1 Tax=Pseudonaja textilis TaxID=8673 RepID=UPI000EA995B1|nr:sprT-like domain-containing protein Spartan isoform X2 [Pseudonaja textilis]